jgi:hypothetical protein
LCLPTSGFLFLILRQTLYLAVVFIILSIFLCFIRENFLYQFSLYQGFLKNKTLWAGAVTQVVEYLPSKCEVWVQTLLLLKKKKCPQN